MGHIGRSKFETHSVLPREIILWSSSAWNAYHVLTHSRDWDELGFKVVRKFLRMIGAPNIALIRHATLSLEDATPCLNPNMHTADDRRFVYDDVLMSVLRALADHAKLQRLDLHLSGKERSTSHLSS